MKKSTLVFIIVALVGLGAGFAVQHWLHPNNAVTPTATQQEDISTPSHRPDFALKDVDGKLQDIKQWDGKVIMINFWATWCPPCRKEIPAFIELQQAYKAKGLAIIGLAIDTRQNVIDFVDPMGINYPVLIGDEAGIDLAKKYGNRFGQLPYTVFIDQHGKIVATHSGALNYAEAEKIVKPLL